MAISSSVSRRCPFEAFGFRSSKKTIASAAVASLLSATSAFSVKWCNSSTERDKTSIALSFLIR